MYRLGWFSTARGPGSRRLLATVQEKIQKGDIPAQIAFVFCSREPGESEQTDLFFDLVRSYGLPLVHLSWRRFRERNPGARRADYDAEVMRLIQGYPVDLCVLAGYMLIVSPEMCRRYPMINLHPSLPGGPAGTWQEVIWQLIQARASESGAMMHLVTPELDQGPVVAYCRYTLRGDELDQLWRQVEGYPVEEIKASQGENSPLFQAIRRRGLAREFPLIEHTLKALASGQVVIREGRISSASGEPLPGRDLTPEVERALGIP